MSKRYSTFSLGLGATLCVLPLGAMAFSLGSTIAARGIAGPTVNAVAEGNVVIQNATTSPTSAPATGTSISSADIVSWASGDVPFAQQGGYSGQVLGTYPAAASIPEAGVHGPVLPNGETLRLGKQSDPGNGARRALAFQLAPRDTKTSGSTRSEISFGKNIEHNRIYWIAFRMYVYEWGSESTVGVFGTQVHSGDNSRGLSPSLSLLVTGSRTMRFDTRYSTSSSPSQSNSISVRHPEQAIPFRRWIDVVIRFRHNTSGNGFMQAWIDGQAVADYRGHLGYNTPGHRDYVKFGIYKWASFNSPRKVLLHSPTMVLDPTGSKYSLAALRAHVNR